MKKYNYFFDTGKDETTTSFDNYKEAIKEIKKQKLTGILYKWDLLRDEILQDYEKYYTNGEKDK